MLIVLYNTTDGNLKYIPFPFDMTHSATTVDLKKTWCTSENSRRYQLLLVSRLVYNRIYWYEKRCYLETVLSLEKAISSLDSYLSENCNRSEGFDWSPSDWKSIPRQLNVDTILSTFLLSASTM